jgi:hypothetical protein
MMPPFFIRNYPVNEPGNGGELIQKIQEGLSN